MCSEVAAWLRTCRKSCSNGCVIIGNLDTRRGKEGLVIALQGGEITTIAQIKKKLQVFLDDGV